ncbi:hypothetical protein THAOC_20583, partial [Thalassiosira oceanica]
KPEALAAASPSSIPHRPRASIPRPRPRRPQSPPMSAPPDDGAGRTGWPRPDPPPLEGRRPNPSPRGASEDHAN